MAGEENLALAAGATAVAEPAEATTEEVVETPAEETPEGGTPEGEEAPSGEETPEEHGEEEHPEGEEDEADYTSGDGRKILDSKLRKGIAELRKTDKVAAKAVADAYFSRQAILKEFPEAKSAGDAIQQIRGMRATLETYGGEQGLTDMKSEVEDWRGEAKQFAEGNPELIAKLGEARPRSTGHQRTQRARMVEGLQEGRTVRPGALARARRTSRRCQLLWCALRHGEGSHHN